MSKIQGEHQRIVGINLTTDRIVSMWNGQDEHNTRAVFELGQQKYEDHGKPVVIGWDEFDSNFGKKGGFMSTSNQLDEKRQKILQSVLEGDTVYDGVSMISLTNEPRQIPVPIYRRFADVVIIKPLTPDERKQLVTHMLSGVPLEDSFDSQVDWDLFSRQTDFASGHILGKIYDQAYANFVRRIKSRSRGALKAINAEARDLVVAGEKVTPTQRLNIFRGHTGLVISASDFSKAQAQVLERRDIRSGIEQQRLFYDDVERLMEEAFKGSI